MQSVQSKSVAEFTAHICTICSFKNEVGILKSFKILEETGDLIIARIKEHSEQANKYDVI